jgi:hypothetical protein
MFRHNITITCSDITLLLHVYCTNLLLCNEYGFSLKTRLYSMNNCKISVTPWDSVVMCNLWHNLSLIEGS